MKPLVTNPQRSHIAIAIVEITRTDLFYGRTAKSHITDNRPRKITFVDDSMFRGYFESVLVDTFGEITESSSVEGNLVTSRCTWT